MVSSTTSAHARRRWVLMVALPRLKASLALSQLASLALAASHEVLTEKSKPAGTSLRLRPVADSA